MNFIIIYFEKMEFDDNLYPDDIVNEITKKSLKNIESKWDKLKILLEDNISYESSYKMLKKNTYDKLLLEYSEIFRYKIESYLYPKETLKLLFEKDYNIDENKKIEVHQNLDDLCYDSCLKNFLFYFRENNKEMMKLIELIPEEKKSDFAFFLCHLFYENFTNENSSQNELILIVYLLLEKEINSLYSPLEETFLNKSFLDYFFKAFLQTSEIKKYLDLILISEIKHLNEIYFSYHSMDIIGLSKKHLNEYLNKQKNYTFFKMDQQLFYVNETFNTINKEASNSIFELIDDIPYYKSPLNELLTIHYENTPINSILLNSFFNEINSKYLRTMLFKEKDDFQKSFYIKQLKLIKNKNDPNIFTCKDYYFEKMVKKKLISRSSIEIYNRQYTSITNFLNKILENLEKKIIIPYNLKLLCKFIYCLFKKKFIDISEFQLNILIGRFLFDKLLYPVLENVDIINFSDKGMITFDTRRTLIEIALVFKKLIRGELFINENCINYNIFNQFIIDNFPRIKKIIGNFIDVKFPPIISQLIIQLNDNEKKIFENTKRNYKNEFEINSITQKCICFNANHLITIYNIVNNNKEKFIKENSKFEKIFNEFSIYAKNMEINNNNKYYLIMKETIDESISKLFENDSNKSSFKKNNKNSILNKLKLYITTLLSKIKIKLNPFRKHFNTFQIFKYINIYLEEIEKRKKVLPLNWYSKSILNNLDLIEEKYKKNDYELLYQIIVKDVVALMKKLKKLIFILSEDINKIFISIKKIKDEYKANYKETRNNILILKTILFIETGKIEICFMQGKNYNELQKLYTKNIDNKVNKDELIISEISKCPHSQLKEELFEKIKNSGQLNQFHLYSIKSIAYKFSSFYKLISEEIENYFINLITNNISALNKSSSSSEINNNVMFLNSSKEALDICTSQINEIVQKEKIFQAFQKKEDKDKIIKNILDYILKSLGIQIFNKKPSVMDNDFQQKCAILNSFVEPKNFNIPSQFEGKDVFKDIINHFNKISEKTIPSEIYSEYGKAINLISLLYLFYFNKQQNDSDEIRNIIIYCLILTMPKRMIFNIYFCQFFMMENDYKQNEAYTLTQIESVVNLIIKINSKFLKMTDEEFNEKCSKYNFQ